MWNICNRLSYLIRYLSGGLISYFTAGLPTFTFPVGMRVWAERCDEWRGQTTQAPLWYKCWPQQTQRADICNKGPVCLATCHVCGDGASRHQLVFTAQSTGRNLWSGLRRVAKKAIVAISSSPDHCPVMSRCGLWSWILRKSWPSVYNEWRDDEAFCHPDVRRDSRQWRVSSGGGGGELGLLVHWSPHHKLLVILWSHIWLWGRHQSAWHLSSSINLSGWVEKYFKIPTLLQISSYLHQFTHLHLEMWPKNEFSEKIRNANLLPH